MEELAINENLAAAWTFPSSACSALADFLERHHDDKGASTPPEALHGFQVYFKDNVWRVKFTDEHRFIRWLPKGS